MISQVEVKSILNKHKQRDSWFLDDYSVNPYSGCSCNCLYCYIRGSKYGENMEEKLAVKTNALEILEKQLSNRVKKNQFGIVAVGSATDAYLQHEKEWQLTEGFLKLFLKYRFPVFISTKCTLILRDLELLHEIDRVAILPDDLQELKRGVILSVSISTLDEKISNMLEPGAATPERRLGLVKQLKEEGFLVGVNAIPLLPFISDTEEKLEEIISSVKKTGADYVLAGSMTLFGNEAASSKTLYMKFIEKQFPELISSYNQLFGEKFYVPRWYQNQLQDRVTLLCNKYEIRNSIL